MALSQGDLLRSQKKLDERGKQNLERARQKAEKERLVAERAAARQAAREEEARQKRLAQLAAEEEVRCLACARCTRKAAACIAGGRDARACNRASWAPPRRSQPLTLGHCAPACRQQERRQHAEEVEANLGVFFRAELVAVPAPESIAADKGIKRAADKVHGRSTTCAPVACARIIPHSAAVRPQPVRKGLTSAATAGADPIDTHPPPHHHTHTLPYPTPADPAAALSGSQPDEPGCLQERTHVLPAHQCSRQPHARRAAGVLCGRGLCGAAPQGAAAAAAAAALVALHLVL